MTDYNDKGLRRYKDTLGNPFHSAIMGLTYNIPTGSVVGALPCGRKATHPLAEGCSPHPGTDTTGPTAAMRSEAKVNHELHPGGTLLNLKLLPSAIEGDAQEHPDNYRDLVVRVAGYCAIFNDLSREVQNEIIRRTTHETL
jgi:formate C-acetyltransferase